jgi:hypothetical protein
MQCYLEKPDNHLVIGQEAVLRNCLHQLQLISGAADPHNVRDTHIPELPALTQQ